MTKRPKPEGAMRTAAERVELIRSMIVGAYAAGRREELDRVLAVLDSSQLMESLAEVEHERWSGWEVYRESVCSADKEAHWKRLRETPYSELAEHSKEADRREVRKALEVIRTALSKDGGCE